MKLSISNIAWSADADMTVYKLMKNKGYSGLEIAPTRIFPANPYDKILEAKEWAEKLKEKEGFCVPSMQSIWYGKKERIFGTKDEREDLIAYTKKAIDFAEAIECKNLVFGCPRNRCVNDGDDVSVGTEFFKVIGEYAMEHNTVIGMEANPPIYNTNYINDTLAAIELIRQVDSEGFRLNLDIGTMIQNDELMEELNGNVGLINHVHISEPGLKIIEKRNIHKDLKKILCNEEYNGFVSIEMGKCDDIAEIEATLDYVKNIFGSLD